jgi:hypothetical protein
MNDVTNLYTAALQTLGEALIKMTSPEWDAMLQQQTPEKRLEASRLMLRVQHARLSLANAALSEIATAMKANEAGLRRAITRLEKTLDAFSSFESVMRAVAAVVSTVGKIVALV